MPNRKIFFDQPLPVTTKYGSTGFSLNISPGVIIPFSMGTANSITLRSDSSGNSTNVILIGSGKYSGNTLNLTNGSFTQTTSYLYSFIMPYDATLQNIYLTVNYSSNGTWDPPTESTFTPYVALATATDNNLFTIISETITSIEESFVGGNTYPANTHHSGSQEGLGISIPAGTKVALVGGLNGSTALSGAFIFRGGLWLT